MFRKIACGFRDVISGYFFGISPRHIHTSKVQCLSEIQQVKKGHSKIPKNGFFGNHYVMVRSRLSSFGAKSSIRSVLPSFAFVLPPLATFPHATAARKTARYVPSTLLTPFSFTPLRSLPSRTLSRLRRRLASVPSLSLVSLLPSSLLLPSSSLFFFSFLLLFSSLFSFFLFFSSLFSFFF